MVIKVLNVCDTPVISCVCDATNVCDTTVICCV